MTDTTLPIWGAPTPSPAAPTKKTKTTQRERDRMEAFERNANRQVPWHANFRATGLGAGRFEWVNFEGIYRGFRQRLLEDPAFKHQVLEMTMERILSELYVPLNHRPQAGLKLSIVRKPVAKKEEEG